MQTRQRTATFLPAPPPADSINAHARLLTYNPCGMDFLLHEDSTGTIEHPTPTLAPTDDPVAVGVHGVASPPGMPRWESDQCGVLAWHRTRLSQWVATRQEFASLPAEQRYQTIADTGCGVPARYATHLGITLAVVTVDDQIVVSRRGDRYAEQDRFDSLIRGTVLADDVVEVDRMSGLMRMFLARGGLSMQRDVIGAPVMTHVAVRFADAGLWAGGWVRLALTAAQVQELSVQECVAFPVGSTVGVPLTSWAVVDSALAACHTRGEAAASMPWPE